MTRHRPSDVYVIGGDGGPTKIGVSSKPTSRVLTLQSEHKRKLQVIATCHRPYGDAFLVERMAHGLLAEKRLHGEWFDVTVGQAVEALNLAISKVDAGAAVRRLEYVPALHGPVGIRLEDNERAALEKAAKAEVLNPATLTRKVLVEWLRAKGWLPEQAK